MEGRKCKKHRKFTNVVSQYLESMLLICKVFAKLDHDKSEQKGSPLPFLLFEQLTAIPFP